MKMIWDKRESMGEESEEEPTGKMATIIYMLYINQNKEVYMANILPDTEVRGSLQWLYLTANFR